MMKSSRDQNIPGRDDRNRLLMKSVFTLFLISSSGVFNAHYGISICVGYGDVVRYYSRRIERRGERIEGVKLLDFPGDVFGNHVSVAFA